MKNQITVTLMLLLGLTACGEDAPAIEPESEVPTVAVPEVPPPAEPVSVGTVPPPSAEEITQATETGTLARTILREPTTAEAALTAAGLTADAFEARVYAIARSPELSTAYRAALEAP